MCSRGWKKARLDQMQAMLIHRLHGPCSSANIAGMNRLVKNYTDWGHFL